VATTAPTTREVDPETQVTISEDGKLSVGSRVPARTGVTVTCEITYPDPDTGSTLEASGSASFTVEGPGAVVITTADNTARQTGELTMTAQLKKADKTTNYASNEVIWELSGATQAGTKIDPNTGVLTVAEKEPLDTVLTVTVKALVDETVTAAKTLTVADKGYNLTANVNATFTEAGQTFRVLVKDTANEQALIIREELMPKTTFGPGGSTKWSTSYIRATLNSTYYNSLGELKKYVKNTNITTREGYDSDNFITTQDYVFLLSEADAFGTARDGGTAEARDYTAGKRLFFGSGSLVAKAAGGSSGNWWLRSPGNKYSAIMTVGDNGSCASTGSPSNYCYVRPAFWIIIQ